MIACLLSIGYVIFFALLQGLMGSGWISLCCSKTSHGVYAGVLSQSRSSEMRLICFLLIYMHLMSLAPAQLSCKWARNLLWKSCVSAWRCTSHRGQIQPGHHGDLGVWGEQEGDVLERARRRCSLLPDPSPIPGQPALVPGCLDLRCCLRWCRSD